ncbi:MAG: hypothetical protein CSA72_04935 [Rhodobacterales bacterium]|nr:MAG: hypothetical protein CSA72_04935 [Rhodobacterales bacterium]
MKATIPPDQTDAARAPLPKMQPVTGPWITVNADYADQMAERDRLLAQRRGDVIAMLPDAQEACAEALEVILEALPPLGFEVTPEQVRRPDGVWVPLAAPLDTLARLITEDICILQKQGDEHVLIAAALLFPSSWTLSQKIGRPLRAIHMPVAPYDDAIAARVQRFFDGVRPGRPLWRANLLDYEDAALYQPRREYEPKGREPGVRPMFWRSERQTVLRLPRTEAVVFAIHTTVVPREA